MSKPVSSPDKNIILKLTYFWAFIEAGLGGLLHFLHVPVTGFVIGGFAIINIVLISKYANNHAGIIAQALATVLAVKFFLSPYTPFGAYIAVGFQGLSGAALFSVFGLNNITTTAFSILVMLESAIQKPLMAWLIFGNDFWKAVILFIRNNFHFSSAGIENMALSVLMIYLLVYAVWALIVAAGANYIRKNIEKIALEKSEIDRVNFELSAKDPLTKKSKKLLLKIAGSMLLAMVIPILITTKLLSVYYLLRLLAVVIIFFVIVPFVIKKFQKLLIKNNSHSIREALKATPKIKSHTIIAYELTKPLSSFKRIKDFTAYAIWLNVFYED